MRRTGGEVEDLVVCARYLRSCPELRVLEHKKSWSSEKAKRILDHFLNSTPQAKAFIKEIALLLPFSSILEIMATHSRLPMFSHTLWKMYFLGYEGEVFPSQVVREGIESWLRKKGIENPQVIQEILSQLPEKFKLTHNHLLLLLERPPLPLMNHCLVKPGKVLEVDSRTKEALVETISLVEEESFLLIKETEEVAILEGFFPFQVKDKLVSLHGGYICEGILPEEASLLREDLYYLVSLNQRR